MQHIKPLRGRGPFRRRSRRVGLDAAFAKAIARNEFGRFYVDDQQQREVRRSLDRAKTSRKPEQEAQSQEQTPPPAPRSKPALWRPPRVRERRTELADAKARLTEAAKRRGEGGP